MSYEIRDHRLFGADVTYINSPNQGAAFVKGQPDSLIIHYTAGPSLNSAVNWFKNPESGASAHLTIDRNGEVVQMVPFNRVAWHAGKSNYSGRSGFNQFAIGIELVNAGFLTAKEEAFADIYGNIYPATDVIKLTHKNEQQELNWQKYTEAQLAALIAVSKALKSAYAIETFLGHDDISPNRKSDPGPAFPMERFMHDLNEKDAVEVVLQDHKKGVVTASKLNVRKSPSAEAELAAEPVVQDTAVTIIGAKGDWLKVTVEITGWVARRYVEIK